MRQLAVIVVVGLVTAGILAAVLRGPAAIDRLFVPDDLTLTEGLTTSIDLVDNTAATAAPDARFTPGDDNADPRLAGQLSNTYSFRDHSSPRYPGFNDCDDWRSLIDDGWPASYALSATLAGPAEGEQALEAARRYWQQLGYQAQSRETPSASHLWVDTGVAEVRFSLISDRNQIAIWATTDCLPPG